MVVYKQEPEIGTPRHLYNNEAMNHTALKEDLEAAGGSIHIPYKQNRMVLFKSNLWHSTATMHFKRGYLKRRINLTLLFGQRESVICPAEALRRPL